MKYTKIDKQGNVTTNECPYDEPLHNHHDGCPACQTAINKCPVCEGEGIDFLDFTNSRGGSVQFQICGLCDGKGIAKENIDYKIVSVSDSYGNSGIDYKKLSN